MRARRRLRPGPVAFLLIAALAWPATACAARGEPAGPAAAAQAPPRAIEEIEALPIPGVADWVHYDTVVFTRRLMPTGEAVAFAFTPREVTTAGRLVGELLYTGRQARGRVPGVVAALAFRGGEAGEGCGAVALLLEPVTLDRLGVRAAFPPISVDLKRAAGPVGRLGSALCEGAGRLTAFLRELGAAIRALGERRERP